MKTAIWIAVAAGALLAESDLNHDLKPLAYFQGSWSCESKFVQNNAPISAEMTFAPELNGAWLAHRHDDIPPYPFHSLDMWGYDKAAKQFVSILHDSGGGVRMFMSPRWDGSKLVWTGDALSYPLSGLSSAGPMIISSSCPMKSRPPPARGHPWTRLPARGSDTEPTSMRPE